MQSTGHSSTQALSLTSIHGSAITYVTLRTPSIGCRPIVPQNLGCQLNRPGRPAKVCSARDGDGKGLVQKFRRTSLEMSLFHSRAACGSRRHLPFAPAIWGLDVERTDHV